MTTIFLSAPSYIMLNVKFVSFAWRVAIIVQFLDEILAHSTVFWGSQVWRQLMSYHFNLNNLENVVLVTFSSSGVLGNSINK